MSEQLFFNMDGPISKVAKQVFGTLGLTNIQEGDSSHVLNGVYYSCSMFGLEIRIEGNSYDYDDKYGYMIGIGEDLLSKLIVDINSPKYLTSIVIPILVQNLKLEIAHEIKENELAIFK